MNFSSHLAQPKSLWYERGIRHPLRYWASNEMTLNMILQSLPWNHFKDFMCFLGARTMYIHTHNQAWQASKHTPGPHLMRIHLVRYSTSARYEKYSVIYLVRPIIHLVRIFALSTS